MVTKEHTLSKSTFIKGCQCLKSLYLLKHFPELKEDASEEQQATFQIGHSVGDLARQLFPEGKDASARRDEKFSNWLSDTQAFINQGDTNIYEAAFMVNKVFSAIDILVKRKGKWYAYEVKASTEVKDYPILDASLQYYVITNSGIDLADIFIVHINNEYVRKGDLDVSKLFTEVSVKKQAIENQDMVKKNIADFKRALSLDSVPKIDIGPHCSDPFECDFTNHCWSHIKKNSVFEIGGLRSDKKFKLYNDGIIYFKDLQEDAPLSERQWLQVNSKLKGTTNIDKKNIREFLETLSYPLYFLDFETINPSVPLYENTRPYQKIPFQFSLHGKKNKNSKAYHAEFLADEKIDPRIPFIEKLLEFTAMPGDILVYNQSFEIGIMQSLAEAFPKYRKELNERIGRVKDLMIPFRDMSYYTPAMNGSYSIKAVLPALVPELTYSDLAISDGGQASNDYLSMVLAQFTGDREEKRKELREYCKLDTYAMVRILEKLEEV